ncbi:MAG TPA: DUF6084 family protein [Gemmataceae bacterium]|nr:DUF6084 family protein [Gemmataceae bacterium]
MPELSFAVESARAEPFAAAPLLLFTLRVHQAAPVVPIHSVVLRCQIRIEPGKRPYAASEKERLHDLFDAPDRWRQTLRPMLWTHASVVLPPFTEGVTADLPAPCTFDFNVAATKYFHALEDGEAPLTFLFSGTVFYEGDDGALQVAQIPWDREAAFRLPMRTWREMMNRYYPNSAWLCLRQDIFDRLYRYKSRRGLPTWEQALESLLPDEKGPS